MLMAFREFVGSALRVNESGARWDSGAKRDDVGAGFQQFLKAQLYPVEASDRSSPFFTT